MSDSKMYRQRCSVMGCGNASSTKDGIWLHKLPEQPEIRKLWLEAVPSRLKRPIARVCTKHFTPEDFHLPLELVGTPRPKPDAVPSVFPAVTEVESNSVKTRKKSKFKVKRELEFIDSIGTDSSDDNRRVSDCQDDDVIDNDDFDSDDCVLSKVKKKKSKSIAKVCRLCLDRKVKMFEAEGCDLARRCEEILNVKIERADGLPGSVCYACRALLDKCVRFRARCHRAQRLLAGLARGTNTVTEHKIKKIDRVKEGLVLLTACILESHSIVSGIVEPEIVDVKYDVPVGDNIFDSVFDADDNLNDITDDADDKSVKLEAIKEEKSDTVEVDVKRVDNDIDDFFSNDDYNNDDDFGDVKDDLDPGDDKEIDDIAKDKVANNKFVKDKVNKNKDVKDKGVKSKAVKGKTANNKLFPNNDMWEVIRLTEEEIMENLHRKKDTHYRHCSVKCEFCFKGFPNQRALDAHMFYHNPARGKFECKYCFYRFPTIIKRTKHLGSHFYKYKCKRCNNFFTTSSNARLHDKYHEGVTYKCDMCDKVFDKHSTYLGHLRLSHRSDFVCPACGENFLTLPTTKLHFKKNHQGMCWPESADRSGALYCATCDIKFFDAAAFDTHLRYSSKHGEGCTLKESAYRNAYAPRVKSSGSEDKKRMFRRDAKPIKTDCPVCGASFPTLQSYTRHHKAEHPAVKIEGRYMCEVCGRLFPALVNLEKHLTVHTGVKAFGCDLCSRKFSDKSNLERHIRTHHLAERPFSCEVCAKRFTSKVGLTGHLRHVHQKLPWPKRVRTRPHAAGTPHAPHPPHRAPPHHYYDVYQ